MLSRPGSEFVSGMKANRWEERSSEVRFAEEAEATLGPDLSSAGLRRMAVEQLVIANQVRSRAKKLTLLA